MVREPQRRRPSTFCRIEQVMIGEKETLLQHQALFNIGQSRSARDQLNERSLDVLVREASQDVRRQETVDFPSGSPGEA